MSSTKSTLNTTKYTSIAEWAKALGSQAKTRSGQRKAIIASFTTHKGIRLIGRMTRNQEVTNYIGDGRDKTKYLSFRQRARQERFAATHPTTLSYGPPATRLDVEGTQFDNAHVVDILTLQSDRPYMAIARYGDWVIRTREDVSWDNNYYSKSYNSKFGGKKTVDARWVLIRRVKADGTLDKQDITVDGWRGNYLLNALLQAGIIPENKAPLRIALHRAYNVRTIRLGRIVKLYERTLGGEHVDYCAVVGEYTFHAASIREAIAGVREKIKLASLKAKGKLIDLELGRALGFCESGMKSFATTFDLDLKGHYTAEQLAERIKTNVAAAAPYASELRTLANAVGYEIPAGF